MVCDRCSHNNPDSANFCNKCGGSLDVLETEEITISGIRPLNVPTKVNGPLLRLDRAFFDSALAARAAICAVGLTPLPDLSRIEEIPGIGKIQRLYGLLGNWFSDTGDMSTVASNSTELLYFNPEVVLKMGKVHQAIGQRIARYVRQPDNERVWAKLKSGKLRYMPCNGALVNRIEPDLAACGLHLPWSVGGYDTKLAMAANTHLKRYGFVVYYAKLGRVVTRENVVCFQTRRTVSTPFGMDTMHSWAPPIHDGVLDEDVGILVEAIAHA